MIRALLLLITAFFLSIAGFGQNKLHYSWDHTKSRLENFSTGFADTFSVNQIKFRIRYSSDDSNLPLVVEKYNKKWIVVARFAPRLLQYSFHDLNNDGYIDLLADNRWQQFVYLFNPKLNIFVKCGYFSSDDSDTLHTISAIGNLYYDTWDSKMDNWWSYLYTIKDYKRYNLGIIEYKYPFPYQDKSSDKYISVRKIYDDTTQKEISKIRNVNFESFDIQKYWQAEKTKFYPNKLMKPNYNYTQIYHP